MKTNTLVGLIALLSLLGSITAAAPLGTAFTYQGRLADGGAPANGSYDLRFILYDAEAGGNQIGPLLTNVAVSVNGGLFAVPVDFGAGAFTGNARWLEIGVRTNGGDAFTTLSPRQPLTPAPYSLFASNTATLGGQPPSYYAPASGSTAYVAKSGDTMTGTLTLSGNLIGQGRTDLHWLELNALDSGNRYSGLDFHGDDTYTDYGLRIIRYGADGGPNAISAVEHRGTGPLELVTRESGSHILLLPAGNVGIGTSNPSNKLEVAGTVKATAFCGDGSQLTGLATPPPGMVLIPAGSFTMGDTLDGMTNAIPVTATISAFYMDVNEVSWSQWQSVYFWATNHGYGFVNAGAGKGPNHPVQTVNWYDCVKWCNARSQQAGRTPVYYTDAGLTQVYTNGEVTVYANWSANGYRLPTEAEWEKAARGGLSGQRFPWGNVINQNLANYYGCVPSCGFTYDLGPHGYNPIGSIGGTSPATSPVGSFAANGYGLNDMAGNVWEWCWDWYGTPYAGGSDPRGPASGSYRVLRGGSWYNTAEAARCAHRYCHYPYYVYSFYGFRCVRGL